MDEQIATKTTEDYIRIGDINNPAGKEVGLFEGSLHLCLKIRNRLTNMLMGQFGIEV